MTSRLSTAVRAVVVVLLLGWLGGCSDGPATGKVRGQVTVDGQPIQMGMIRFVPQDPGFPSGGGEISGGRFEVTVPATRHRVEVNGVKMGANGKPISAADSVEELVPAKYNLKSELVFEVKPGDNTYDLDLKSK